MSELDPIDRAVHTAKVQAHRLLRWAHERRAPVEPARRSRLLIDLPPIVEVRERLWNPELDPRELPLELGKVENLRVAARALHGLEFEAGQRFSFWAQVGPPARVRGFVAGRELREGCVVPGIGGGLCLVSNALYGAAMRAGFEILERHPHSRRPPGSRAALGEDATVAWNYIDLRFVAAQVWRLEVRLDSEDLVVRIHSERRRQAMSVLHERRSPAPRWAGEEGRSCLSCDRACGQAEPVGAPVTRGRRSWLVDAAWPEFTALARTELRPGERLLQPIDGARLGQARYAWSLPAGVERRQFPLLTLARSARARGLAAQGPARQRAMLTDDRRLAQAMAATLGPEDTQLVVSQSLLPHLWRCGALGGRRVRVLMQRLPLLELQARLDQASAHQPESATLADFRADPELVEAEARALDEAVEIITPHRGVAACFPGKARLLEWQAPGLFGGLGSSTPRRGARGSGKLRAGPLRLYFPASTVARKGARELRAALAGLGSRLGPIELRIAGRELEGPRFWAELGPSVRIVRGRATLDELGDVDAVLLPAWVEHEPRELLRALASGTPVIASHACGLGPRPGLEHVAAGEIEPLVAALTELARAGTDKAC